MEPVGRHAGGGGVASIAASHIARTCFLSAGEDDGALKLWDMRLPRKKDFMTIASVAALCDIGELLFDHAAYHAVAACAGGRLVCLDIRRPTEPVAVVQLPTDGEDVSCTLDSHRLTATATDGPATRWDAMVADDNGFVYPLEARALFNPLANSAAAGASPGRRYGGSNNVCCGLGVTTSYAASGGNTVGDTAFLWSVSMGGVLQGFQGWQPANADDAVDMRPVYDASIGDLRTSATTASGSGRRQLHNPPIPTCLTAAGAHMVVGRGDGTYTVLQVSEAAGSPAGASTGAVVAVEEVLSAPAHQENGLVYVQWMPSCSDGGAPGTRLLTVALSGEITGWDLGSFLGDAVLEDDDDGSLPPVVFAAELRQDGQQQGRQRAPVVNCCDLALPCGDGNVGPVCFVGDSMGNVFYCPVA